MPYERKTVDIFISNELKDILKAISSQSMVAKKLLYKRQPKTDLVDEHVNYISVSKKDKNKISYLNNDRLNLLIKEGADEDILWHSSKRYNIKPGSFVKKIFKDIPPKEVELFSNLFKSESNKSDENFKIIKGKDIRNHYHGNMHSSNTGTLGTSCMKHDHCQPFFDIYCDNTDTISMLALLDKSDRVLGRALLWDFDDHKIMDRIYSVDDEKFPHYFKKWATKNGYLYKSNQNWYDSLRFENLETERKELFLKIDLKNKVYQSYPYFDTFKFVSKSGILHNYQPKDEDFYTATSTDGRFYDQDFLKLDEIERVYKNSHEIVYVEYLDINTSNGNTHFSNINNTFILRKDGIYDEELNDYIFNEEFNHKNANNLEELRERQKEQLKKDREFTAKLRGEYNDSSRFSDFHSLYSRLVVGGDTVNYDSSNDLTDPND